MGYKNKIKQLRKLNKEKSKLIEEDYLDEDPIIDNQRYYVLSYFPRDPTNVESVAAIKIRGCYRTQEECSARIKLLQEHENSLLELYKNRGMKFKTKNMGVVEVGKWMGLYPEYHEKSMKIETEYLNEDLNKIMYNVTHHQIDLDKQFNERVQGVVNGTVKELDDPLSYEERVDKIKNDITEYKNYVNNLEKVLSSLKEPEKKPEKQPEENKYTPRSITLFNNSDA
jgi:hypothetical protein